MRQPVVKAPALIPLSDEHVRILRAEPTVRRVEYVKYPNGNEYWISLQAERRLDMKRLETVVSKNGFKIVRFGSLPSNLPKGLAELVWNGVTHVILREFSGADKLRGFFGFEPEGIARIAQWGHGPYQLYVARDWAGMKIFFDYLDLEMPSPPPAPAPPKPAVAPVKPTPASAPGQVTAVATPPPRPVPASTNAPTAAAAPAHASQQQRLAAQPTPPSTSEQKTGTSPIPAKPQEKKPEQETT